MGSLCKLATLVALCTTAGVGRAQSELPPREPASAPAGAQQATPDKSADEEEQGLGEVLKGLRDDVDGLLGNYGLDFYGHFKLDMSRDSSETNFGNTAFFVKNHATGKQDDEANLTARHTRLGMNWKGKEYEGIKASGKLEMDFLGKALEKNTATQETQSGARLRLAYMKFDFPDGWTMIAGQDWDAFGRLSMQKLNSIVGWGQGNVAFRRAMLKFLTPVGDDVVLSFAIARPVSSDSGTLDGDSQDDGEDSGVPDLQANIGFKLPSFGDGKIDVNVGGYYGWRELGAGGSLADQKDYDSYAVVLDLKVPLTKKLTLLAEGFVGQAMDGYRGGVWQSYSVAAGNFQEVDAIGGFLNLDYKASKKWRFVVGAGIDDPNNDDLQSSTSAKYRNSTIFGNVRYSFYPGTTVGFEYDRMQTDYLTNHLNNDRVQVSFMAKF